MFEIVYRKKLRIAAAAALSLQILYQLVCILFFKEHTFDWNYIILLMEAAGVAVLWRGERSFITALPFLALCIFKVFLSYGNDDAMRHFSSLHLLSTILVAIIFVLSMAGRMYEHKTKLAFLFLCVLAVWGYDLFLLTIHAADEVATTLMAVRMRVLFPLSSGLCAAWAAFPTVTHNLSEEEVEAQIVSLQKLLTTGMISEKEYRQSVKQLLKKK